MKGWQGLCWLKASAFALGFFGFAATASAQIIPTPETTIPERQSVLQHSRPDYDALGLRAGSFLIFPSAEATEAWDSNIYATSTADKTDMVTTLQPAVSVASDWNNHALNLYVGDQSKIYATHTTENVNNLTAAAQGRFDIQRDFYITGGGGFQLLHEDRASPNAIATVASPNEYHVADGNLGITREVGLIGLRLNTAVDSYSYNNSSTASGALVPESYRNYIAYTATPRISYEIVPGYHAFVQFPLNERQYASNDLQGIRHNSHGYEGDIGTAFNLASALNGEVFIGYLRQEYESQAFSTNQGLGGGANLLWNVTDLTSLRLAVNRTVQETDVVGSSGFKETSARLTVEHELLPNVLLNASGTYAMDQFSGAAGGVANRSDNNYIATVGAKYLLNRVASVGLEGTYFHRDSNAPGVNYDREIIGVKLRMQL